MDTVDPKKDRPFMRIYTFLRRKLLPYRPWSVYWTLFFGPWTWLFRALSWIIPKQPNLYIFGSNEGLYFSDNSRAMFEYIQANDKSINAIWFTKNKRVYSEIERKYPGSVVISPSLRAAFIYLRAEQAVISFGFQDLCKMPWIPSIKINQLWHGIPIKKIGLLRDSEKTMTDYGPTWPIFVKWMNKVNRFFVASEYEKKAHSLALGVPENRFIVTGNPRNDDLYKFTKKSPKKPRLILYTPTFRNRENHSHRVLMHPEIDEIMMHDFLIENDAKLVFRPHWIEKTSGFSHDNIQCISHEQEPDLYQLFKQADILITDYSSAFIDWLILDKPVIFAPYDLDEYTENNGFLDLYQNLVPSPICTEADQIFEEIKRAIHEPDFYHKERRKFRRKYLGDQEGNIRSRVWKSMTSCNHTERDLKSQ